MITLVIALGKINLAIISSPCTKCIITFSSNTRFDLHYFVCTWLKIPGITYLTWETLVSLSTRYSNQIWLWVTQNIVKFSQTKPELERQTYSKDCQFHSTLNTLSFLDDPKNNIILVTTVWLSMWTPQTWDSYRPKRTEMTWVYVLT